jgi:class 3 adenylate cyclase
MWLRSVFLILGTIWVVAFTVYDLRSVYIQFEPSYQGYLATNQKRINATIESVSAFAANGGWDEIRKYLEREQKSGFLHFYRIAPAGQAAIDVALEKYDLNSIPNDCSVHAAAPPQGDLQTGFTCPNGNLVVVGFRVSKDRYGKLYFKEALPQVAADIGVTVLLLLLLLHFGMKDVALLRQRVQTVSQKRGDRTGILFYESRHLVSGFKSFESSVSALQRENKLLRSQILQSVRSLLNRGKKLPYTFDATMARTDINNYSTIFESDRREAFLEYVDEFFRRISEIITRYNGYPHQLLGDEMLYYFEASSSTNSARMALAALTEIAKVVTDINARSMSRHAIPFQVKSSIATSPLRVAPFMNVISLAGRNLIESVRVLASAPKQDEFSVVYGQDVQAQLAGEVSDMGLGEFELKGLGRQRLFRLTHVPSLEETLARPADSGGHNLQYYRSDIHVAILLAHLASTLTADEKAGDANALKHLLSIFLLETPAEIKTNYLALLRKAKSLESDTSKTTSGYQLASVVGLALRLITPEAFQNEIEREMNDPLFLRNERAAATVVTVLSHLAPDAKSCVKNWAQKTRHNRTLANHLIKISMASHEVRIWRKKVGIPLRKMLRNSDLLHLASGLYALGEISLEKRSIDPVWLEANDLCADLLDIAEKCLSSGHPMVRRQAMLALKKAGRDEALHLALEHPNLPDECRSELTKFLEQHSDVDFVRLRVDGLLRAL